MTLHPRHGLMVVVLQQPAEVDLEQVARSRAMQSALGPEQPFGWQKWRPSG